jgi:hypothetical protein
MGWMVRGSNPVGGEIFRIHPDQPWGPPSLLYNGYWVFPGGNAAGAWRWPPTPFWCRGWEWVKQYLCSPSRPLVVCYTFTFTLLSFVTSFHFALCSWLSWLRFSVFSLSLSRQMPLQYLSLDHDILLPYHFQFIVNRSPDTVFSKLLTALWLQSGKMLLPDCVNYWILAWNISLGLQQGIVSCCKAEGSVKTLNGLLHHVHAAI